MYLKRHLKPKVDGFSFWHFHHFFSGFTIMTIGFYLTFEVNLSDWFLLLSVLGSWIQVDDVIQHILQRRQIQGKMSVICPVDYDFRNFYFKDYYDIVTFWHWFPEQLLGKKFRKYDS